MQNKKIIRTLTLRSLMANRWRNGIAIFAIVLTATLFTTIFAVGGNMLANMQNATMRMVGTSSHGGFKFLTRAQYDTLAASPDVKDISYSIIVGGAENAELRKKQTELRFAEDDFAKWGFSYPTVGAMPQSRMDLACSTLTLDALGIPHELGQTVPLTFTVHGKTYSEEFTLCGFWPGDDVMVATQVFLSREYVDAVAPAPETIDPDKEMDDIAGSIMADLWFSNTIDLEGKMERLVADSGFVPGTVSYGVNWAYAAGEVDPGTALLVAVLVLLALAAGYLIIYSIFIISVTGDIRFYGLLKTIGATPKQIRRIVRGQALALSLIGIPLGLGLGFLVGQWLMPFIFRITTIEGAAVTSAHPAIFLFSAAFSLVTVFISCRKPGRVASKVSPVEAVRYVEAGATGKRKQKRAKKVTPFSMALANVRRSQKKLVVVVLSLSLSLVLMNSVVSLVQGFDMEEYLKKQMRTDFSIADHSVYSAMIFPDNYEGVDAGALAGLAQLPGLEDAANIWFYEDIRHQLTPKAHGSFVNIMDAGLRRQTLETWARAEGELDAASETGIVPLHIYGYGKLALDIVQEDAAKTTGAPVEYDRLAEGDCVLITEIEADYDHAYPTVYAVGDKIPLVNAEGEVREFKVIGTVGVPYPLSAQHSHIFNSDIVMAENTYLDFYGARQPMMSIFNVADEENEAAEKWLSEYCGNANASLDYRSRAFYMAEFASMQRTFFVCGGALALVLALIGVLNFVNTSFTSILARRRELAMLQSVGMTGRQLRAMLFGEGALYALFTLLFAATAGSLVSWLMLKGISAQMWFFQWHFTLLPLALAAVPLVILCAMVPLVCYRSMQKESVVDRLREE